MRCGRSMKWSTRATRQQVFREHKCLYMVKMATKRESLRVGLTLIVLICATWTEANDNQQQQQRKFELKFQTELDNSTVIKQLDQQQIFKCQVRLGQLTSGNSGSSPPPTTNRVRLKSWSRPIDWEEASALLSPIWLHPHVNVSRISIVWLKDDRLLGTINGEHQDEPVGVINVTLKGQTSNEQQALKVKRMRLEIKNTMNGNQLKLTSRLRLGHLKAQDAGQYKCVARAIFIGQNGGQLELIEQALESNSTALIVSSVEPAFHDKSTGGNILARKQTNGGRKKWITTSDAPKVGAPFVGSALNQMKHRDTQTTTNQLDGLASSSSGSSGGGGYGVRTNSWNNLFEDDEDLFQLDASERAGELINAADRTPSSANEENNDNTNQYEQTIESSDSATESDASSMQASRDYQNNYLDWILQESSTGAPQPAVDGRFMDNEMTLANNNNSDFGRHESPLSVGPNNEKLAVPSMALNHQRAIQVTSFLPTAPPSKLVKFVHKLAPGLSCYTGSGEFYHGNVATSADQRPCLNWLHVRLALMSVAANQTASEPIPVHQIAGPLAQRLDNHNSCRNPNLDARGPWCFVGYSSHLDGALAPFVTNVGGHHLKLMTDRQRIVRVGANRQLFVMRTCQIASCSEYLWLYIVAPPLGLLVLLTCLLSLLIRSIRKSHYNAIFSAAYQRHKNSTSSTSSSTSASSKGVKLSSGNLLARNLNKMFASRKRRACFSSSSSSRQPNRNKVAGNYLSDDIFEIVDDIDWSEGQTISQSVSHSNNSMSPKSNESFKLNSASFQLAQGNKTTLTQSKSINPMFSSERGTTKATDSSIRQQQQTPLLPPRQTNQLTKSKSQAGPMFATLRCHVRNTHLQQQQQHKEQHSMNNRCQQQQQTKKSSSFIDNGDLMNNNRTASDWLSSSTTSPLSSPQTNSSTSTTNTTDGNNNNEQVANSLILASDLPRLELSSVTLAHEPQPIYEGKFSQVQWAYLKQHENDAAQATGRIGAQVAVCTLKQQAALDERVFQANNLRLRNLNHLNVLKLIGYLQYNESELQQQQQQENQSSLACALVYDMAHLIDLNDWLKDQAKEALIATSDELTGELSLRQNLTCLAKQIALAVDYLHDKQIVYKDLACRNCFLDVTRMLVKLATFNIEPEFESDLSIDDVSQSPLAKDGNSDQTTNDNKRLNLKSMVRPKYLLDYYVIDSRPSECQLLALSWIPLESILFNKFNKQTDIWSFGCLLYELFSLGEVAYFGYSSKQVIDSVRSNLMPPQPMLCPNGIYKLMCKCLSDIPTLRPDIKHVYEQLNLYSGQCSSFLNHHLCII